jgi:hypothetical protein
LWLRDSAFPISRDHGDDGDSGDPYPLPGHPTSSQVIPEWRRVDGLPTFVSFVSFVVKGFCLSDLGDDGDVGDYGDRRAQRATPPRLFPFLLQTKDFFKSTLGSRLGGPWVTLA